MKAADAVKERNKPSETADYTDQESDTMVALSSAKVGATLCERKTYLKHFMPIPQ